MYYKNADIEYKIFLVSMIHNDILDGINTFTVETNDLHRFSKTIRSTTIGSCDT